MLWSRVFLERKADQPAAPTAGPKKATRPYIKEYQRRKSILQRTLTAKTLRIDRWVSGTAEGLAGRALMLFFCDQEGVTS